MSSRCLLDTVPADILDSSPSVAIMQPTTRKVGALVSLIGKSVDVIAKWVETKAGRVRKCHAVLLVEGAPLIVMARQEKSLLETLSQPGIAEAYATCIAEADALDRQFNGALAHRPANKAPDAPDFANAPKAVRLADLRKEVARPVTAARKARISKVASNAVTASTPSPRA